MESFPASDAPYWTLGIEAVSKGGQTGSRGALGLGDFRAGTR